MKLLNKRKLSLCCIFKHVGLITRLDCAFSFRSNRVRGCNKNRNCNKNRSKGAVLVTVTFIRDSLIKSHLDENKRQPRYF